VNSAIGPTFAAGASFGSRWVQPSIEIRYTRWTDQPIFTNALTVHSRQDEAQILAGLMVGVNANRPDSTGVLEGAAITRRVSLGIKGGLLLTDALSTRLSATPTLSLFGTCVECGTSRTLPYVFGPALEVGILGDLSATVEAFYSHADYDHTSTGLGGGFFVGEEKRAVDRWEAPLLLEYSIFKTHRLRSFVSGGASIQYDRDSRVQILRGFISRGIGLSPPQYSIDTSPGPQMILWLPAPPPGSVRALMRAIESARLLRFVTPTGLIRQLSYGSLRPGLLQYLSFQSRLAQSITRFNS
jgi:hypothetical protein